MNTREILNEKLRVQMEELITLKGIKQLFVASQIGVHHVTFSRWINGKETFAEQRMKTVQNFLESNV
ncbi:hypothetical protein [Paenisporosarcina sp. NPDC076898]|uniref:hypothetical protein n=1 Tax=unclassified Paenisporosarcina TaxID=2642018 RepID=UPI003D038641